MTASSHEPPVETRRLPMCLLVDEERPSQRRYRLPNAELAVVHQRNPSPSSINEDAGFWIADDRGRLVLGVADGVGGSRAGGRASRLVVECLQNALAQRMGDVDELQSVILLAIQEANEQVLAMGIGAATTLAVAEIDQGLLRTYHVGDSTVALVGQRGKTKWQTVDHSRVGYAVEAGIMEEKDAFLHDERHIVLNVVGSREMRIEIGAPQRMSPRDTLLLATDGLLDNIPLLDVLSNIRCGPLAERLFGLAGRAEKIMTGESKSWCKPDDLTAIAYRARVTPVGAR